MAIFDFSTLNSTDFEDLVRDLLNANEKKKNSNIEFKTFKEGKDRGIDIAYSTAINQYDIVGQAKHYYRSGYNALIYKLKNEEVDKVRRIKPTKYLLATSVDLSFSNTQEIQTVFTPFIKSLQDVYGKKEINMYLDQFPDVLQNNFKLWFSSSDVLLKIINYNIQGRSNEFIEGDLKKRLRLYVKTQTFDNALSLLKDNKFLIITGEPGVGKTTLAELLLYEYIKNDYELIYIYDDIKEVENVLSNDDKKQIIYFDDFLGHNSLEINKARGSESAFLKILRRISNSINKHFILTTRTFILNSAIEESENLRRFNVRAKVSTLKLSEYDLKLKEKLVINHLDESDLDDALKNVIQEQMTFIINNKNFSPRSIEFITSHEKIKEFSPDQFKEFIIKSFHKPDEIWRHAYEEQINDFERILLNTFVTFGDSVEYYKLENAFNHRIDFEITHNNLYRPVNIFQKTFRKMLGGFIVPEYSYEEFPEVFKENVITYKFINPSLVDFLINYISNDSNEFFKISESAYYIEQLTSRIIPINDSYSERYIPDHLENKLVNNYKFFIKPETENTDRFTIAMTLFDYVDSEKSNVHIHEILSRIDDWSFIRKEYNLRSYFENYIHQAEDDELIKQLKNNLCLYINPLIQSITRYNEIKRIFDLLTKAILVTKDEIFVHIRNQETEDHLSSVIQESFADEIDWLIEFSNNASLADEKMREFMTLRDELRTFGLSIDVDFSDFNNYDWDEISDENYFREQMAKDD